MFEPMVIAFIFPYSRHFPWQLRRTPKLLAACRQMHGLSQTPELDPRNFCRIFCQARFELPPCQQARCGRCYTSNQEVKFHVYRPEDRLSGESSTENLDSPRLETAWNKNLRPKDSFHRGRPADHLLIPFECDRCIFLKIRGHLPSMTSPKDKLL